MKKIIMAFLAFVAAICAYAAEKPLIYVIDLNEEVDAKMWMQVRRACEEAKSLNADMMLLHINTYGGAVDSADSIRTAIMRMPMPTIAFVDPNAASAGSLITLACDTVYMSPGASYGASSVVNQSGEIMPDKYQSYMKSVMRSTAESHGKVWSETDSAWVWRRDPAIAESFVTPEKVTTLTPEEAIRLGYAEGTATSIDDVISRHYEGDYEVARFESTASDTILGFLASAAVRAVLIMLIIGGIYMEMHTPGIGVAGGVAFVAAVLYFLPILVGGTMASWVVVLFIVGILLFALEIFVIPGFGICGISGIVAILASLVGGMLNSDALSNGYAVDIVNALVITTVGVLMAVALVWFLTSKHGPKWVRRVSELQATQQVSDGYIGVDASLARYLNAEAVTVTDLRPSGKIEIDGECFDAVSMGAFIDTHKAVKVVKFENAQLYVREIE